MSPSEPVRPTLEALQQRFGAEVAIEQLAGDASTRIYYRLREGGSTSVLVDTGHPFDPRSDTFIAAARLLASCGLPVPGIFALYPDEGLMILEDLGELLLQRQLADCSEARRLELYEQAVDHLVRLHVDGTLALARQAGHPASLQALDRERFLFEFEFFREHYLTGLRGIRPGAEDSAALTRFFEALADEVAGFGRVLAHRDYHSRNLMLHRGRLVLIDFQDARWGPLTYDLASLLRDSYVALPDAFVELQCESFRTKMLARLESGSPGRLPVGAGSAQAIENAANAVDVVDRGALEALAESLAPTLESAERFRRRFDLTCLQRNIKALGTFGYQASARGNPLYLRYIPPTARHIRENMAKFPEFTRATEILGAAAALPED